MPSKQCNLMLAIEHSTCVSHHATCITIIGKILPILTSSPPGGPPMVFIDDVLKIDYADGKVGGVLTVDRVSR